MKRYFIPYSNYESTTKIVLFEKSWVSRSDKEYELACYINNVPVYADYSNGNRNKIHISKNDLTGVRYLLVGVPFISIVSDSFYLNMLANIIQDCQIMATDETPYEMEF